MREYPYPYPWRELPGRPDELAFLERRFAEMSVLEQNVVEGVAQLEEIDTAADLINLTAQLYDYKFLFGAVDTESLGRYVAKYHWGINERQAPFMDYTAIGESVEENGYAYTDKGCILPDGSPREMYDGENLAEIAADVNCIRLKIASRECPEGVWLSLPDDEINTDEPHEKAMALDALGVGSWNRTILLDARCCFENIQNIAEQYDSMEALLDAADNFGYVYAEAGQGQCCFRQHWQAAMELEGCTRLDHALDISQNLHCYGFVPSEAHWQDYGKELARWQKVIDPTSRMAKYFDGKAFAAAEIERLDLQPCTHGYIRRNEQTFNYEYSQPPDQGQGMVMK